MTAAPHIRSSGAKEAPQKAGIFTAVTTGYAERRAETGDDDRTDRTKNNRNREKGGFPPMIRQLHYLTHKSINLPPSCQTIFIMDDDGRFRIPARKITAAIVVIPAGEPAPMPELEYGPNGRIRSQTAYFCLITGCPTKTIVNVGRGTVYFGGYPESIPIPRDWQNADAYPPIIDWQRLRTAMEGRT